MPWCWYLAVSTLVKHANCILLCREARSLLSERVKHEEEAAFAAQAGGFQPEVPAFARHI